MVKHADSCCLMEAVSLGTLEYTLQWQCRLWHGVRMIDRPTQFWPPSVSCASLKMLYHLEMVHVPEVRIHTLWLWNLNPMILGSSKPSYCHNKSLYRVFIYLFDVLKRQRYRNEDIQSTDLFMECPPQHELGQTESKSFWVVPNQVLESPAPSQEALYCHQGKESGVWAGPALQHPAQVSQTGLQCQTPNPQETASNQGNFGFSCHFPLRGRNLAALGPGLLWPLIKYINTEVLYRCLAHNPQNWTFSRNLKKCFEIFFKEYFILCSWKAGWQREREKGER